MKSKRRTLLLIPLLLAALAFGAAGCAQDTTKGEDPKPATAKEADEKLVADLNAVMAEYTGTVALKSADAAELVAARAGFTPASIVTKQKNHYLLFDAARGEFVLAALSDGEITAGGQTLAANTEDYAPEALFVSAEGGTLFFMSGNEGDPTAAAVRAVRNYADALYPDAEAGEPTAAALAAAERAVLDKISAVPSASVRETLTARFAESTFANAYGNIVRGEEAILFSSSATALTADSLDGLDLSDYDNICIPAAVKSVDGAFGALSARRPAHLAVTDSALAQAVKAEAEAESLPLLVTTEDGTRTRNSEFVRRMRFNRETILENLDKINAQLRAEGKAFAELRVTALNADGSYEVVIDLFDPETSAMSLYGAVNTALDLIRGAGGKTATVAPSGYTYEDIVRLSEAQGRQFLAADRLGLLCTELGLEADPAELAAYAEKYGTDYTAFDDAARALLEEKLGTAEVDAEIAARTENRYTTLSGMTAALLGGDPDEVLAQAAKTEVSRVYPKLDLAEMSLTSLATEIVLGLYCDPEAPLSAERSMYNVLIYVRDHIREIAATLESFAPYCINRITVGAEIAAEEGTLGVAYHFTFCERFGEGA